MKTLKILAICAIAAIGLSFSSCSEHTEQQKAIELVKTYTEKVESCKSMDQLDALMNKLSGDVAELNQKDLKFTEDEEDELNEALINFQETYTRKIAELDHKDDTELPLNTVTKTEIVIRDL